MTAWIVTTSAAVGPLVALAATLDAAPTVVVVGPRATADAVARLGVGRVRWVPEVVGVPAESFRDAVAALVAQERPRVVLAPALDADRALAAGVAVALRAPVLTLPVRVEATASGLRVTHAVAGGIALRTVEVDGPVVVVGDAGEAVADPTGEACPVDELTLAAASGLVVTHRETDAAASVDLGSARRIVAVGRGLREATDLEMVRGLAEALGAEVACTRPLASLGWLPHERCVGLTGRRVAPDLYVAIGVSGQLQHLAGARGAGTIVAVNSDPSAPIFGEVDYGLVGDLYTLVPALTRAFG